MFSFTQDDGIISLTEAEKKTVSKNFAELKTEMSIDTKQLSQQRQIRQLQTTKSILEKKLLAIQENNHSLERSSNDERKRIDALNAESEDLKEDIRKFNAIQAQVKDADKGMLAKIQSMVLKNEELRQYETKFKEQCRQELAELQKKITYVERDWLCDTKE